MKKELQPLIEALQQLDRQNAAGENIALLEEKDFPAEQQPLVAQINRSLDLLAQRSRKEQKSLEVIHNIIHSGMWGMELDRAGQITAVNWSSTFRRMLGFTEEDDFPNRLESWTDRLHPEDKGPTLKAYWDAVAGRGTYDVEYRLCTKSGEYRWYRDTGEVSRREDGTPSSFLGIFVDITEKKQLMAERQAAEAETRHDVEQTLEGSRTGLWSIELEEGCAPRMYADRTMGMLLGLTGNPSPEECYRHWFDRVEPDYRPMVEQCIREIREKGRSEVVYPWSHPTLGKIYIRCGGVPDPKFSRPGVRLKGYHQDITETMVIRKQQEKALMEALVEAKQASRAKTEFLSHMSHDIRTPINGILGMLEISEQNPDDPARQQDCRRKIRGAAQHLLSLINDVLDISKLESGSFELRHEPFALRELLENCLSILRPQAEAEGLDLQERWSCLEDVHLVGSPLHLRQILINILGNAVKYNRPGGAVELCTEQVGRRGEKALFRFTVTDTGIGMSEEFLKHIFEPFTQENAGVRTHYQGTGLGMAITKRLVEQMGGEIQVTSRLGEGSCFVIELPFEIDRCRSAPCEEKAEQNGQVRLEGLRLLLAEDNELNREIAQYMLEDAGAEVVNAADGRQALELFAASAPGELDGVLMEVMMPVMNGLEATRAIRALDRPDAKTVPIIAMTANAFAEDVQQCLEAGMNAHLAKPLDLDRMFSTITELCGGKR